MIIGVSGYIRIRLFCQNYFLRRQPERVPGIISVRPDTSDTGETALLPELAAKSLYNENEKMSMKRRNRRKIFPAGVSMKESM